MYHSSKQFQAAVSKVSQIMACITNGIYSRDKSIPLPLYKNLVPSHLEYADQFWLASTNRRFQSWKKFSERQQNDKDRGSMLFGMIKKVKPI